MFEPERDADIRDYSDPRAADARWRELMAPETGDVYNELVSEAATFFSLSFTEARTRAEQATARFAEEWEVKRVDPTNPAQLIDFYNQSEVEVFDLIRWHASDPIHHRTLHCVNVAAAAGGRMVLDYGSGIGSDAIVFANAGFEVTLADVSDPLLQFAKWRCEKRGFRVRTLDLKKESPPAASFDAAICFDVLEHVPDPTRVTKIIARALKRRGYLFIHAPFGDDPARPMHIIHEDCVTPRMRSLGFQPENHPIPSYIRPPYVYRKTPTPRLERLAYYVADVWLPPRLSQVLRASYRRMRSIAGRQVA